MAPLARGTLWRLREAALGSAGNALVLAQLAQIPRHLPRRLRKSRKFRGICRDVCASCASTTAFTETFAQAAQVPRHLPRRLREAAQIPRHLPRRLRRLRKFRGECFGVCASCASTAAFTETFAQVAQVPRHLPRRLRKLRKSRGICRDVCAGRANTAAFTETFAGGRASLAENQMAVYFCVR